MFAKTLLATLGIAGALLLGVTTDASAHGWRGPHRHHGHRPIVRVVRPAPVVIVRPAPVIVRRAPVLVAPPVVVAPPAPIYRAAPVVAPPAPVVVAPAPRRW